MPEQASIDPELESLLHRIYGEVPAETADWLHELIGSTESQQADEPGQLWSQRDVVLITYADQIRAHDESPLSALRRFMVDHELTQQFSCIHLLPFCPYTSDDGFSVVDYLQVDPESGTWEDIDALSEHTDLMFDLVLNHCSQQNAWFQSFLNGAPAFDNYFVTADPSEDLSAVTRPRSLPLLTSFKAYDGERHVWTTFSADQVDLNYSNPAVLRCMTEVLVEYARRGARIIRLDAIAFLWKEFGTTCIHLPQTHAIVQLMRYVLDRVCPGTIVLTETNVPHAENISYFGEGDEAHMVYQFSLPPLLLEAIHSGDCSLLKSWLRDIKPPYPKTSFFNFTASHDGIGVRPLEGLVPQDRLAHLIDAVRKRGGKINTRRTPTGEDRPYELNITYVDAVAPPEADYSVDLHARRFLATQAIMLSVQGVPAVYFHSLVGTRNDYGGVESSGQNRRINRHKYDRAELDTALSHGLQRSIFDGYRQLIDIRVSQPAFHPDAMQQVVDVSSNELLAFRRYWEDSDTRQSITVIANLSGQTQTVPRDQIEHAIKQDLLSTDSETDLQDAQTISLEPFQIRWLSSL